MLTSHIENIQIQRLHFTGLRDQSLSPLFFTSSSTGVASHVGYHMDGDPSIAISRVLPQLGQLASRSCIVALQCLRCLFLTKNQQAPHIVIDLAMGQHPGHKRDNENVTDGLFYSQRKKERKRAVEKSHSTPFKRYVQIYKARVEAKFLSGFITSSARVAFISARTSNRSAEEPAI